MKKVLLSAALLLASSAATVMASMAPEASKPDDKAPVSATAMPVMVDDHKGHSHAKGQKSKEDVVAKLAKKAEHVRALGKDLTGLTKELYDSAMGRFDAWVKVIGGFTEKDTSPSITAKRAKHELNVAKTIAKYANGIPAEKFTKWEEDLARVKDGIASLTGDMKTVAETQLAHATSLVADAKKAKDTPFASMLVNAVKYEMSSLKKLIKNGGAKKVEVMKATTPAAMPAAIDMKAAPVDAGKPTEKAK
ncbi:MAG: hypothetical protein K2Q34_03920 [Alphaproteobacteria bacterium]|nr:hypothetical protein [Alphaproteobacteria bacterium]